MVIARNRSRRRVKASDGRFIHSCVHARASVELDGCPHTRARARAPWSARIHPTTTLFSVVMSRVDARKRARDDDESYAAAAADQPQRRLENDKFEAYYREQGCVDPRRISER